MFTSVAYVWFFINCEQGRGRQPFICLPFLPVFGFSRSFIVRVLISLFVVVKLIAAILLYFGSWRGFYG